MPETAVGRAPGTWWFGAALKDMRILISLIRRMKRTFYYKRDNFPAKTAIRVVLKVHVTKINFILIPKNLEQPVEQCQFYVYRKLYSYKTITIYN